MNVLPLKDLLHAFNENGRFPSEQEMKFAIRQAGIESITWQELELNLIKFAENNEKHPYHKMVVGGTFSPELSKMLSNAIEVSYEQK